MRLWLYVVMVCIACSFSVPVSFADIDGDVLVGVLNATHNDLPDYKAQISTAIHAGISDFNKHLDETGADWRFVAHTADPSAKTLLHQIQYLHDNYDINIVLGPLYGDGGDTTIHEAIKYAQSNDIVIVGCCAATPDAAIPGDTIFQIYPDAIKQGSALAHILHKKGIDVVIPIYRGGPYGDDLWRSMADDFVGYGGVVDKGVRYDAGVDDFDMYTEILSQRVQHSLDAYGDNATVAILLISFDEGLKILTSASSHDTLHKIQWFADESLTKSSLFVDNGTAAEFLERVNYTSIQVAATLNAQHDNIRQLVLEEQNVLPGAFAYAAYDAVWILGNSVLGSDTADATSISGMLPNVADAYTGIMGDIKLDVAGDMQVADYTLWTIKDSQWERTARYNYDTGEVVPTLPDTVIIPVLADITGDLSVLGREGLAGMALAASDFNKHQQDTSADWRLELNIMDSETDPAKHRELIRVIKSDIVLSCAASNSLVGSIDYIGQEGLAVVSSCSTSAELAVPDGLFRLYPDDGNIIDLLTHVLEDKSVIMIVRNDSWGTTQSHQLSHNLDNHTVILYPPDAHNYDTVIQDVLASVAEYGVENTAILLLGFAESAGILASAADHDVLYDVPWVGSNGNARHPEIVTNIRSATFAELVGFTAPMNADAAIPAKLQLDASYVGTVPVTDLARAALHIDKYVSDRVPVAYASGPVAYDSLWLTVMTINSTKSLDAEIFQNTFVDLAASHTGVTGPTKLNESGDLALVLYDMWTVRNGSWVFESRYDGPAGILLSVDDLKRQALVTLMVESAIADFAVDANSTISALNDPNSTVYTNGELFVFAIDVSSGKIVAHVENPDLVDTLYADLVNSLGVHVGELIVDMATPSGVWVSYVAPNPSTGLDEPKLSWIKSHDNYIFGVGMYPKAR